MDGDEIGPGGQATVHTRPNKDPQFGSTNRIDGECRLDLIGKRPGTILRLIIRRARRRRGSNVVRGLRELLLAKITVHETDVPHVPRVVDSCIDNIGFFADQSAATVRTAELICRYQVRDESVELRVC
jgi:hypothetical protein